MRILHLSDIHLSHDNEKDFKQYYLEALIKDIESYDKIKAIDLIVITGDLLDKGGGSYSSDKVKNNYQYFETVVIDKIISKLKKTIPVFYTIGNHDLVINSVTVDEIIESGLESQLSTIDKINAFIDKYRVSPYAAFTKQEKYKEFEKSHHIPDCIDSYFSNFESAFVVQVENKKVGIVSLNSAWRCNPELPNTLPCFGSRQVLNASDFFKNHQTFLNIALIHHSPQLFEDQERREVIKFLETKQIDIIFCGHKHTAEGSCLEGPQGNIFFLTARCGLNDPREKISEFIPGYSILDFDKNNNQYSCIFRRYVHSRVEFDFDVDAAPLGEKKGIISHYEDRKSFKEILDISTNTFDSREDDLNSALVIYGTNTTAPQKLKDIFVLPKITNTPESYASSSTTVYNSIDSIICASKNVLIFGKKESGKTILLNTLYSEISRSVHLYQKIPVLIDFNHLHKKDLITLIRGFLNIGATKAKELLTANNIVILLDNVSDIESESGSIALRKIIEFTSNYPDVSIIATSDIDFDAIITDDQSFINKLRFKPLFINNVGTEQFKNLASKWFANRDSTWYNDNITKLIKTFEILRIPHTFFSITLFLWIIEKQENFKPQNQSILVDTFLRYILEGLKSDESKAGTYNYDRKIELLSEIAYDMYKNGDKFNNYGQKESNVLAVIEKNFTLNQRKWLPSEKVDEFVTKGILCRCMSDSSVITFRFESFFKYLLSMNMDSNPDFLEECLDRKNIISFIDELDFYTGRNQQNRKVLDTAFIQLGEAFEDFNKRILDDVDQYLPKKSLISGQKGNDDELLKKVRKAKLTDEEIDAQLSEQFDSLPVSTSIQIKQETDNKVYFHKVLELAARVLKNSENIKDPETINMHLNTVIKLSAKYTIFLQSLLINSYKENQEHIAALPKGFIVLLAPLINELMLLTWLGTDFIEVPLRNHIEMLLKDPNTSELELYLVSTLFSDMHFQRNIEILDKCIKKIKNPFIAELFLMKMLLYYMMRPNSSNLLPELERQIKRLLVKARGLPKSRATMIITNIFRKNKLDKDHEDK